MPARNVIEFAVIQERYDGQDVGPKIAPCKITINGESPNAMVRASVWSNDLIDEMGRTREPGFVDVDHLVDAEVIDPGGKLLTIRGTSDKLQFENRLSPDQAYVEWIIEMRGCQGCS